ncbi:MAG: quinol:cytochrome C oxidoreductase [Planctomycetota bacterium]|nr:quinol:cytochrome C oxidoreductase [Planctomycetota bacterium]
MHSERKTSITSERISLGDHALTLSLGSFVVGAIAIVIAFFGFYLAGNYEISGPDSHTWFKRFLFSYHASFCFCLSLSVGALFVVLILHLTRAGWGIVVRRLAEIMASVIFPMLILFSPIFLVTVLGSRSDWGSLLYIWNNETFLKANSETMFAMKQSFLSSGWYGLRIVVYFSVWGLIALYFLRRSTQQDVTGEKQISRSMQVNSGPLMIIFAFVCVFAAFDLEMSLAPRWFSTMFPVCFFAGSVMGVFATLIVFCNLLQKNGILTDEITVEHYHDLSKLTFAFVFFWGYVSFSQFMLIWYANIPEETFWFRYRLDYSKGWAYVSLILLFGHLLIPFVCIMARSLRRNKQYMLIWAILLLAVHWLDHYWLVMPQFGADPSGHITANSHQGPSAIAFFFDVILAIGMIGLYLGMVFYMARGKSLIPVKDPRLVESMNFKNP